MSYKEEFNEWSSNMWDAIGRNPTLSQSEAFRSDYVDDMCDRADQLRKEEKENPISRGNK